MSNNTADFVRPIGVTTGVLLNTNNEALQIYKKTKKRMSTIPALENKVQSLTSDMEFLKKQIELLQGMINDRTS